MRHTQACTNYTQRFTFPLKATEATARRQASIARHSLPVLINCVPLCGPQAHTRAVTPASCGSASRMKPPRPPACLVPTSLLLALRVVRWPTPAAWCLRQWPRCRPACDDHGGDHRMTGLPGLAPGRPGRWAAGQRDSNASCHPPFRHRAVCRCRRRLLHIRD